MPADERQILRYWHDCYRENGSRSGLWQFFASSVSHRIVLDGVDKLARQHDHEHFLRGKEAAAAAAGSLISRREKDLLYGSVFLMGWLERQEGKPEAVCAPLFLYPANLREQKADDGPGVGAYLTIDGSRRRFNYAVFEALGDQEALQEFEQAFSDDGLSEHDLGRFQRLFQQQHPGSDVSALTCYPHLHDSRQWQEQWEQVKKNPAAPLTLIPGAALALVNKSTDMRGVLHELERMADPATPLSLPVRALIGVESPTDKPSAKKEKPDLGQVPASLSAAQQKIIRSAREHPVTLAIGPPGTGKSFTIAALAIETISRGGSVLVASRMDHAVDVVGDKIEAILGWPGVVTRGGRRHFLRELRQFVDDLLIGLHTTAVPDAKPFQQAEHRLRHSLKEAAALGRTLERHWKREQRESALLKRPESGFGAWWLRRRKQRALQRRREAKALWQYAGEWEKAVSRSHDEISRYLKLRRQRYLQDSLDEDRECLQQFSRALRSNRGSKQEEYFSRMQLRAILKALPVWLVNLSDLHRILPLQDEAFDLAIIDEATQCDLASAMPVLQRAKHVVIAGDPKQLRHLSFLPLARQEAIARQYGLDEEQQRHWHFRNQSLLDGVADRIQSQEQVAFLNEHFRSQPPIIGFSNRNFYQGQLHIMTAHRRRRGIEDDSALIRHPLETGRRLRAGHNPVEAGAILAELESVAAAQQDWPDDQVHTLGVLSPFRDQVEHIRSEIQKHPLADIWIHRHQLMIGTAHTFQGEERDRIYLSLALDDEAAAMSFRFLEKPDVFNVSITRARWQQVVFHSFDLTRLSSDSLLYRYLGEADRIHRSTAQTREPATQSDTGGFLEEVATALRAAGAEVRCRVPFASDIIDILYHWQGQARAIELVGHRDGQTEPSSERLHIYRRAGLRLELLSYVAWQSRRRDCLDRLLEQPDGE